MSRNRWRLKLSTAVAAVAMLAGITVQMSAQVYPAPRFGNGGLDTGVAHDWSHHHLVFSNPGTEEEAIKNGTHDHWLKVGNDPRYILQLKRRHVPNSGTLGAPWDSPGSAPESTWTPARRKSPLARDWNLQLGRGTVAPNMSPAKYSFDTSNATLAGDVGPPPTGNCLTDFVVYGLNVAGGSGQANLVAIDDLYSGTNPTGMCGVTPEFKWAYNVSTIGGAVTTSPVLSWDGTMVAFVESNGSASVFHVLKWEDSSGTASVAAPVPPAASSDAYTCAAPCMVSLSLSSATTRSSPFYDYSSDTIYVGNNAGRLFKITGVFGGTPTLSTTNGWSAAGVQVAGTSVMMTAPVLDLASGNIFIGGSDGKLYAVSSTSGAVVGSIAVGSGSANGGGIVDAPIVDGTNGTVLAYAAANAALVGATTANTTAVTVQARTTPPTPWVPISVATIGQGSLGLTANANINVVAGDFDNLYYTWSGPGANPGHLYMIGTDPGGTAPRLYQIGYTGSVMSATPTTSVSVTGFAAVASPITEFYNTSTDLLFFGFGLAGSTGYIESRDVSDGSIGPYTRIAEPNATGGTSGIVVDNISTKAQAASIYFTALGSAPTENVHILSMTSNGCRTFFCLDIATVTTDAPVLFTPGVIIYIAGVTPNSLNYNGFKLINTINPPTNRFTIIACIGDIYPVFGAPCPALHSTNTTGTLTYGTAGATTYSAIKLTQIGLD
jgi:hypothetical protein